MTCRYCAIRHSMFYVIPHGMLPVQYDLIHRADRRAAVSGLALRSLLEKVCITMRPLATVISQQLVVHSLISTLKEETNLCSTFFCLLHCVEVVEMTDFRKPNLPFA
jgi:hypothetical protein